MTRADDINAHLAQGVEARMCYPSHRNKKFKFGVAARPRYSKGCTNVRRFFEKAWLQYKPSL